MGNKSEIRRISIAEMAPHVHSFLPDENKTDKIANWLIVWIKTSLAKKLIKPYDYLPAKSDLAFHIGVSLGTIQNAFRIVEDTGLISSKQKIGTYISPYKENSAEKSVSKRDVASDILKKYIKKNYKIGQKLDSIRHLSRDTGISPATIRVGIRKLVGENIIEKLNKNFIVKKLNFKIENLETATMADIIAEYINNYIKDNLSKGDKIPAGTTFADMYGVSVKTVHDAIKILTAAGILKTRRGCYGTFVYSDDDVLYYYEQVELKIKQYIIENCKIGDKLPSIKNFAEVFNVSTKTITNALNSMERDGYIKFIRGRNGGTIVADLPMLNRAGYEWLALSPDYKTIN